MPDTPVTITYDDYSLQDDSIIVEGIGGDLEAPEKIVTQYELPVSHGAKRVNEKYQARRISIFGKLKSPTVSGLVGKIEEFLGVMTRQDKTLQITYPGPINRIYTATLEKSPKVQRDPWSLTLAPFEATFLCVEPWSVRQTTTISGVYDISNPITQLLVGFSGTADAQPRIYFNTTASGTKFLLQNQTTNESIEISTTFSGSGRSLLVDMDDFKVQLDGADIEFKGQPMRFLAGQQNDLRVVTAGTSGSALDQYFQNTALYLSSTGIGKNNIRAQSFVPTIGKLLYVEFYLAFNSGTAVDLTVELQADNAGVPSGTALATATIPAFTGKTPEWRRAIFPSVYTVTPGTTYWLVVKAPTATYDWTYNIYYYSYSSQYASGKSAWQQYGQSVWQTNDYDRLFRTYGDMALTLTGKLVIEYNPRRW